VHPRKKNRGLDLYKGAGLRELGLKGKKGLDHDSHDEQGCCYSLSSGAFFEAVNLKPMGHVVSEAFF